MARLRFFLRVIQLSACVGVGFELAFELALNKMHFTFAARSLF
jgi:hypothetical protein